MLVDIKSNVETVTHMYLLNEIFSLLLVLGSNSSSTTRMNIKNNKTKKRVPWSRLNYIIKVRIKANNL